MPIGSPADVPCRVCHERIPGLAWGERCAACIARRHRRAAHLARRASLVAALLTAAILGWQVPPGPDARTWIGGGTLAAFFLVRMIVLRAATELLPD